MRLLSPPPPLQFVLQLEVTYQNGTRTIAASSDPSVWKTAPSPTLYNNIYLGVRYDARLETPGWDTVGFDDALWGNTITVGPVGSAASGVGPLEAQQQPPVRRQTALVPRSVRDQPAPMPNPPSPPSPPGGKWFSCGATCQCGEASEPPPSEPPSDFSSFTLACKSGTITGVSFASYGDATGKCGNYTAGSCDASATMAIVGKACIGKPSCTLGADRTLFGDPCVGTVKTLKVQVSGCTPMPPMPPPPPPAPPAGNATLQIVDLGKNFAGVCQYRLQGTAGDTVNFRYGELLFPNGSLNPMTSVAGQVKSGNGGPCAPTIAWATDRYVVGQTGRVERWAPEYTWHAFRYVEIDARDTDVPPLKASDIVCYPMRSDVAVISSYDTTANPLLGNISTLIRNTFESNLMSIQSDCPHRERFGYGGDALASGEAGMSIFDFSSFYEKRMVDYSDSQAATTDGSFTETAPFVTIADAGLTPGDRGGPIGWATYQPVGQLWLYRYYGNLRVLQRLQNSTEAFVRLLDTSPPGIDHGLGDWMPVEHSQTAVTGRGFLRECYLAYANISSVLGNAAAAAKYSQAAEAAAARFNAMFLNKSTGGYAEPSASPQQCNQAQALFMGLVPEQLRQAALGVLVDNLASPAVDGHMQVGMFGIKWFLMALAENGRTDLVRAGATSWRRVYGACSRGTLASGLVCEPLTPHRVHCLPSLLSHACRPMRHL